MSFISNAAHQKFILQCHSIISSTFENDVELVCNEQTEQLSKNLVELQQLMETYLHILSEIPKLTCKYYNLHARIRVNVRKIQQKNRKVARRKSASK